MGQLSFLQLRAGRMPSFCERSQSHGEAQDVGWPWATDLAAAEAVTFVPNTGLDYYFFFVFTRVLLSYRKKNCSAVWVFILASDFFFFFLIWVFGGFFSPQVKPLFVICSCPTQPEVLGTPRTMSGFSKQHPNKKKGMESDVDQ